MSKVIFKMKFKHPNFKTTTAKNMGHIVYIATRPGTDKTITPADLKKELDKGIENMSEDETYINYIDERPRSHGLFGQDGIEDPKEVSEEISQVNSYVWRGIISLTEEDAKNLGYLQKDKWQDMLRKKMPDMAKEMNIPLNNLRWVGAVHMEKGHPHAHVVMWEKEPKKTLGVASERALNNIRKIFTDEIFEEERTQLLTEKNVMRDLLRDLSENNVGGISKLLKEVRATGQELKALISNTNLEGVVPKLYNEEELKIAQMVKSLSEKLPGKGRANLKFMPDDVKEEIYKIVDYLLQNPEMEASLEKSMIAVEKLTRLYTGKEKAIEEAKNNAYKDLRDRVAQVILKGAVESQRDNLFYVDKELSEKAVSYIENMNSKLDLGSEKLKVLTQIATDFYRSGYEDEKIISGLLHFVGIENLQIKEEQLNKILKDVKDLNQNHDPLETHLAKNQIEQYLKSLKLIDTDENTALISARNLVNSDIEMLDQRLSQLSQKGLLNIENNVQVLTEQGISELLLSKNLDQAEQAILGMLENSEGASSISFDEMMENQGIFAYLKDKDPDEITLGKFDSKIRNEFGELNHLTLGEYEDKLLLKYTSDKSLDQLEKVDKEFDIFKKRLDKLVLNGYIIYDRETNSYSFSSETDNYFEYNFEKEEFVYTEEAILELDINTSMEFTRYDASLTLSYIDKAENQILTSEALDTMLKIEIVNATAQNYHNCFTELFENHQELVDLYISTDEEGNLQSNNEGKKLGIALNKVNKIMSEAKDHLDKDQLEKIISSPENESLKAQVEYLKNKNILVENEDAELYVIDPIASDVNKLLYQIHKAGGVINKNEMKETLERINHNKEAEGQFKYLTKRLNSLKEESYVEGKPGEYKLTEKGHEKRADLLIPQRDVLRKNLKYLMKLGFIKDIGQNQFIPSQRYYKYKKYEEDCKLNKVNKRESIIPKGISDLIDKSYGNINLGKLERNGNKVVTGIYLNKTYDELDISYDAVRSSCGVKDLLTNTLNTLSTTLLVSGIDVQTVKTILMDWNERSKSNLNSEKIIESVDQINKRVENDILYGKVTLISSSQWKETFASLGISENNMPKWIYKGENWKSFHKSLGMSAISDMWKATWRELEKQRMQSESQADHMKKQMAKQQALQSKSAQVEQSRKNKDRGSLYRDEDELDR